MATRVNGPGSLRTERSASSDQVGSGAERQRYRAAPVGRQPPAGHESAATAEPGWHRGRLDLSSREDEGSFRFREANRGDTHRRADLTRRGQTPGRPTHDTVLLRATRDADLETPIGAFLALDDGTPAYLLESVEGGERLGRYSFLGMLPRRLLEVRDGMAIIRSRPVGVEHATELTAEVTPAPDPLDALRRFMPRRSVAPLPDHAALQSAAPWACSPTTPSRAFEPTVPLPRADPVGTPLAAFLETDLVIVFDHLTHTLSAIASLHTDAPDFDAPLPDRRARRARSARADRVRSRRQRLEPRATSMSDLAAARTASLGRAEYIAAVETAKEHIAAGEVIQVVLAPPPERRPRGQISGHRPVPRAAPRQPQPVPVLRSHA